MQEAQRKRLNSTDHVTLTPSFKKPVCAYLATFLPEVGVLLLFYGLASGFLSL